MSRIIKTPGTRKRNMKILSFNSIKDASLKFPVFRKVDHIW